MLGAIGYMLANHLNQSSPLADAICLGMAGIGFGLIRLSEVARLLAIPLSIAFLVLEIQRIMADYRMILYTDQIKLLPDVNRFNYFVEVSLEFVWVDILLLAFVIFLCIPKTGEVFK